MQYRDEIRAVIRSQHAQVDQAHHDGLTVGLITGGLIGVFAVILIFICAGAGAGLW